MKGFLISVSQAAVNQGASMGAHAGRLYISQILSVSALKDILGNSVK